MVFGWALDSAKAEETAPSALSFSARSEDLNFAPEDIWAVEVRQGAAPGEINLEITLNGEAKDRFARFTSVHVGQPVAVFVGGVFLAEPVLQTPITGGRMAIAFPDQPSAAAAMDLLLDRARK